jgi:hypothetical protein
LFPKIIVVVGMSVINANALPILQHPSADDLGGPVFIQPFAGLSVVSVANSISLTEPFFADLPDGSLPRVVNILGNFQAFDPDGNTIPFDIAGVEVADSRGSFTPPFGAFNFAGRSSMTFTDSLDFDTVTYSADKLTLAFPVDTDPSLAYSYRLLLAGPGLDLGNQPASAARLFSDSAAPPLGSFITFTDVETDTPEPATFLPLGGGLVGLLALAHVTENRRASKR